MIPTLSDGGLPKRSPPPRTKSRRDRARPQEGLRVTCDRCREVVAILEAMKVIGHRGASVAYPHNTPAAFAGAEAMGADGVELDVRIAPDGVGGTRLVVFHNPLPADQQTLDAMPGFDEVLDACGDRLLINVEIKNSDNGGGHDPTMAVVAPTVAAMRARGPGWAQRWLFSSFDFDTMDHCRQVAPDIPTALLVEVVSTEHIAAAAAGGHSAIHPWAGMLTSESVHECHEAGLAVNSWTCNDPERLVELEAMGVDGICTDVPDVARHALGRVDVDAVPTWTR